MKLWNERPMPPSERKALTCVVVVVWVIALAMNVGHVADHLSQMGFSVYLAVTPDFLLLVGVWKLRYRPKAVVAWLSLAFGLSWLVWSALSTTRAEPSHQIIALAPIGVAIVATLLLELGEGRPVTGTLPARKARPQRRPVSHPEPTVETILPADAPLTEPLPLLGKTPPDGVQTEAKPTRPSRDRAREILLGLDDLGAVSNGQLSRSYGGSDVWWGQQKKALQGELDRLGDELPAG